MEQATTIGTLIEPDPIRFSFGAPGWWLLVAVIGLVVVITLFISYRRYRRHQYRRDAIQLLVEMASEPVSASQFLFTLISTLKRVSFTSYGRDQLAALDAKEWLLFVEQKEGKAYFSSQAVDLISENLYRGPAVQLGIEERRLLLEDSLRWIKKHHV